MYILYKINPNHNNICKLQVINKTKNTETKKLRLKCMLCFPITD